MPHRKRKPRLKPPLQKRAISAYWALWRLVDGEVRATFQAHPDYLRDPDRERVVRNSVNKRVVGRILSWASQRRDPGSLP